jgi:hypothetical protein
VECTSCGLNGGPLVADGEYPAPIACNITNGRMPHATNRIVNADIPFVAHDGDLRFITNIKEGTMIGFKYFAFSGPVLLTIKTRKGRNGYFSVSTGNAKAELAIKPEPDWSESSTELEESSTVPLYLTYHGEAAVDLLSIRFNIK